MNTRMNLYYLFLNTIKKLIAQLLIFYKRSIFLYIYFYKYTHIIADQKFYARDFVT